MAGGVSKREIERLSYEMSFAFGATVVGVPSERLSDSFHRKYRVREMVDYAWQLALGNPRDTRIESELDQHAVLGIEPAEAEGYPRDLIIMGASLISAARADVSSGIYAAHLHAMASFGCVHMYSQGFGIASPLVMEYFEEMSAAFDEWAGKVLHLALERDGQPIGRSILSSISLDARLLTDEELQRLREAMRKSRR